MEAAGLRGKAPVPVHVLCASGAGGRWPSRLTASGGLVATGEPAGFLRRPEIPENALGCIQSNHTICLPRPYGSPSVLSQGY